MWFQIKSDFKNFPLFVKLIYIFCVLGCLKWLINLFSIVVDGGVVGPGVVPLFLFSFLSFFLTLVLLHKRPSMAWMASALTCVAYYFTGTSTFGFATYAVIKYILIGPIGEGVMYTPNAVLAFALEIVKTWLLYKAFRDNRI